MRFSLGLPDLPGAVPSIRTSLPSLRPLAATLDNPGSLYWPARAVSSPFRRLWFAIDLEGLEHVPTDGPFVLAPNHISFLDSFLLMYALPGKVVFMGKAEYLDSWKTRLFPAAGMIPVDRSGKGLVESMRQAGTVLDDGGAIGIFPEGTRSNDGAVHRGHTGAAHLALRHDAALIPVGIIGTDIAQPPGAPFPTRDVRVTLRFGAPIDTASITEQHGRGSSARRAVTDTLMLTIAQLANRLYDDTLLEYGAAAERTPASAPEPEPALVSPTPLQSGDVFRPAKNSVSEEPPRRQTTLSRQGRFSPREKLGK